MTERDDFLARVQTSLYEAEERQISSVTLVGRNGVHG
jgi:hypothetical protein